MRRRDLIAGGGSLALLASGVLVARGTSLDSFGDDEEPPDPLTIETVDVRGSEQGSLEVPSLGQPMFIDFFGTWCPPCVEQMPALAAAHEQIGDEVRFVSVTNEAVGSSITVEELDEWWRKHGGNWTVGLDRNVELAERYGLSNYPLAVAIDDTGRVQWSEEGVKTTDELLDGIERAR